MVNRQCEFELYVGKTESSTLILIHLSLRAIRQFSKQNNSICLNDASSAIIIIIIIYVVLVCLLYSCSILPFLRRVSVCLSSDHAFSQITANLLAAAATTAMVRQKSYGTDVLFSYGFGSTYRYVCVNSRQYSIVKVII